MATAVIPNEWRTHVAVDIINSIATTPENSYYVFLGNHMPDAGVLSASDDTNDTMISAYRNMICAKVVTPADASMMVRNIPWVANTAYAMYDDLDMQQETDQYFAIVNAGAFSHIWKVLDNNMGAVSTAAPDISQINSQDISYRTSDGYLWKYMASTPVASVTKFGTDDYFPITANAQVTAAAIPGAIDTILISNTGQGYNNWLLGSFAAQDVRVNGNNVTYAVTGNNVSSTVNGFYTNCNIYISGGTGVGQYKSVVDYFSNANGNYIVVDSPFTTPPQNGSTYQIYPGVVIISQGKPTINAAARALVNAVGNTIYRIDMLNRGQGYNYINTWVTANAVAAPLVTALTRGIYGPFSGHGFNAYEELGATRLSISVTLANNEANTIPATNDYQQIGILKDPLFQNVVINFTTVTGSFLIGEKVQTYNSRLLQNNVTIVAGSANVSITNGVASSQLFVGDPIVLNSSDFSSFWYTTVNSVVNSTFLTVSSSPPWACSATQMSLAIPGTGQGTVISVPTGNSVALSNVTPDFVSNSVMIGLSSGTIGQTNTVSRNDVVKHFSTFVPMRKFVATSIQGTFLPNEVVYMNALGSNVQSATSTAALHSVFANSGTLTLYTSNTVGQFSEDPSGQIIGANSGATATITTKYSGEIVFGSSKVLYLENIAPATRSNTTSDTINVILEF